MNGSNCGCATQPCGCCEGVEVLTPAGECNRPGLDALSYRAGTHAQFLETMKARLSAVTVQGVGADGQTPLSFRPLTGLSTRDSSDFSIALLDGWATIGDVLTFYQERIANEGYLRTATERRSVLELSRLVGYTLRPGVAATAYLAYTLDDNQVEPVTIAAGARSQSVPGPGEQPQYFETSEDLAARREWNNLQVRMKKPQDITLATALTIESIQVAGSNTGLRAGDKLLLLFADDGSSAVARTVTSVDTQFADQSSAIHLQALDPRVPRCLPALLTFQSTVQEIAQSDTTFEVSSAVDVADTMVRSVYLANPINPQGWYDYIHYQITGGDRIDSAQLSAAIDALKSDLATALGTNGGRSVITDPSQFVTPLLLGPVPQARNSLQLNRNLAEAFLASAPLYNSSASGSDSTAVAVPADGGGQRLLVSRVADTSYVAAPPSVAKVQLEHIAHPYADTATQLLVNFRPRLQDSYYQAWAGANLNPAQAPLIGLYALRSRNALFGANAAKLPAYYTTSDGSGVPAGTLKPQNLWTDWSYAGDENAFNAFLDQANDAIAVNSYVLVHGYGKARVVRVSQATTAPRSAYGLSAQSTQLVFELDRGWRKPDGDITDLRTVQVYSQSEPLTLADMPVTDDVGGTDTEGNAIQTIELDGLYRELTSGRWVILSGERTDIEHVKGVQASELLMISGISHSFDPNLPGDTIHTTLTLATPTAYQYKRDTVTVYGNVVKASQGATCNETLGSGDGAQSLQSFTLKQPPLTFVAAPTAAGAASTLHAYVNNVEWHQTDSLAWLGPKDRGFTTLTDDAGNTTLVFGDGEHGARLPSGVQNITAVYRSGIGSGGNVKAGQISLLQTRPLGVKAVVNPLRASGGADPETRDLARENAPLSVMSLDRLVSLQDYADFTRRFAGIAKAVAQHTTDGSRELIYLTIAGVDDAPIDPSSDLYTNLMAALVQLGDPDLPIRVDVRELKALALSARIHLLPDYQWEPVVAAVRSLLLDRFGFDRRALGQPALRCEVISAIQGVAGVGYVDIEAFGAVPEKTYNTDDTGQVTRDLLTQNQITEEVAIIAGLDRRRRGDGQLVNGLGGGWRNDGQLIAYHSSRWRLDGVEAFPGGYDGSGKLLRPAELAIFTPAVPDTLILNQIP
jgi:predicted phage baseplate assembly protein